MSLSGTSWRRADRWISARDKRSTTIDGERWRSIPTRSSCPAGSRRGAGNCGSTFDHVDLPQLHLKEASGGRGYGLVTPTELVGVEGAKLGVTRQWISETGSVQLRPGQPFPDEVTTVISSIVTFDTAVEAEAWITQAVARASMPVALPVDGATPGDLVVLRAPGVSLGELQYLAFFSHGDTAFSLLMVAGGSGGHDGEFVRLVQDWIRQTAVPATPSITEPSKVLGGGGPATPGSRP